MESEQRYFYINITDFLDERNMMIIGLVFKLLPTPRMINKDRTITGDYYEFTHFSSGVMIDQELAEFWKERLKAKGIRSFFRKKPFFKKKKNAVIV